MERKAIYLKGHVTLPELEAFLIDTTPEDSGVTDIVIGGSLLGDIEDLSEVLFEVPLNLWVMEHIAMFNRKIIKVHGDLHCARDIDAFDFIIKGDFTCKGYADITCAEVGGDTTIKGNVGENCTIIRTLGDFTCCGDCGADVLVGGLFICEGKFTGEVAKA